MFLGCVLNCFEKEKIQHLVSVAANLGRCITPKEGGRNRCGNSKLTIREFDLCTVVSWYNKE